MALNLITLEEAARILGKTVEDLNTMRERREIHGYRDGAAWKFKRQDIERLANEERPAADGPSEESIEFLSLPLDIDDDDSSIDAVLLSERELGESQPGASSTVIGKPGALGSSESDIRLIAHDEPSPQSSGGSDVKLIPAKDGKTPGSDVKLVAETGDEALDGFDFDLGDEDSELSIDMGDKPKSAGDSVSPGDRVSPADAGSSLKLADSAVSLGGGSSLMGGSDINLAGGSTLQLGSHIVAKPGAKSPAAGGGSDVSLGPGHTPGSDVSLGPAIKPGSDVALGPGEIEEDALSLVDSQFDFDGEESDAEFSDSSIDLDADRKEPVRGGSSDVTRRTQDSGISLASPADSGLSLEEPLELSGLGEEPYQLGEDPLMSLGEDSDSNEVANLKSDDDFLLTPLEEKGDGDSEDSGSQVIALDTDSSFDAPVGGLLAAEDELSPAGAALGGAGLAGAAGLGMAPGAAPAFAARDAQYSIWDVLQLGVCVLFLSLSGMMTYDLMRNMWSWRGNFSVNSPLMDLIANWFG